MSSNSNQNPSRNTSIEMARKVRNYRRQLAIAKTEVEKQMFARNQDMFLLPDEQKTIQDLEHALQQTLQAILDSGLPMPDSVYEKRKADFARRMQSMITFSFEIGSQNGNTQVFDYLFINDQIVKTTYMRLSPADSQTIVVQSMNKGDFVKALSQIDLVDWFHRYKPKGFDRHSSRQIYWSVTLRWKARGHKVFLIEGFNDFPYNFEMLLALINQI